MSKKEPDNFKVQWASDPDAVKELEYQIKHDQEQPVKPSEKRVKLNTTFDEAVKQLSNSPTKDKQ